MDGEEDNRLSAFGSTPDQLGRMFAIGKEDLSEGQDSILVQKAELLEEYLAGPLPLAGGDGGEAGPPADAGSYASAAMGGASLGEALLDSGTELGTFRSIRAFGKAAAEEAHNEVQRDAAATIYHAAIASALRFAGQRITSLSVGELCKTFASLARKPWMPPDLARHFRDASQRCVEGP